METTLYVNQAIPKHAGKYQCNRLHKNFHTLTVIKNDEDDYSSSISIKSEENFTPVDNRELEMPESGKTTTRHHHHHHKISPPILEEEIERTVHHTSQQFNALNRTTSTTISSTTLTTSPEINYFNGNVSIPEITTPFIPLSLTTMLVDSIKENKNENENLNVYDETDQDENYDEKSKPDKNSLDNDKKSIEMEENKSLEDEELTITESNRDPIVDVDEDFDFTTIPEITMEMNFIPLEEKVPSPSIMTVTVAQDLFAKNTDSETTNLINATKPVTYTTISPPDKPQKGERLLAQIQSRLF